MKVLVFAVIMIPNYTHVTYDISKCFRLAATSPLFIFELTFDSDSSTDADDVKMTYF